MFFLFFFKTKIVMGVFDWDIIKNNNHSVYTPFKLEYYVAMPFGLALWEGEQIYGAKGYWVGGRICERLAT